MPAGAVLGAVDHPLVTLEGEQHQAVLISQV